MLKKTLQCFGGAVFSFWVVAVIGLGPVLAAQKEADVERSDRGVMINKDETLVIPEDQKIYQVAKNVMRVEDPTDYVARKMDMMDSRIDTMADQMKALEARVQALEDRAEKNKEGK